MKMWIDASYTPDNWCKYLIDTFEWLYEESNNIGPRIMSVGIHLRIIGRPGRINALKTFLEHVKNYDGIWFGTRHEIAEAYEKQIPNPISVYGLNHFLSENICNYYDKTTNTTCINLRLSNSYGSPVNKDIDCWWLVLNEFCKSAYQKQKITIRSDGSALRDFIHWYDIINALELIIKNNEHDVYHIASGQTLSILELAYKVKDVYYKRYNKEVSIYLPKEVVKSNIEKTENHTFSIRRLHEIGYKRHKEVPSGINEIFDYMEGA